MIDSETVFSVFDQKAAVSSEDTEVKWIQWGFI